METPDARSKTSFCWSETGEVDRVVASVPFKRVAQAALERTEFRMNKIVYRRKRRESLPGAVAFSILKVLRRNK
jgi:hypothetical protein